MRSTVLTRRAAVVAVTAAAALGLTACSGASTSQSSAGASQNAPTSKLVVWADSTKVAALKSVVPTFEKQYDVTVTVVAKDNADAASQFVQQAPTGKAADVFAVAADNIGNFAKNGVISPITIADESLFSKVGIAGVTYDGKTYGMPVALENIALIRNVKLDPSSHDTFAELLAAGDKLKAAGKVKYPVMIQSGQNGASDPYHLYPLETSFGVPVFGTTSSGYDPADLQLGNANGVKWAQQLATWGKENVLNPNYSGDIAINAFTNGQTPYIITGPWNLAKIKAANVQYSIDKIPSAGGQPAQPFVGVQTYVVNKYSENALLANKFVADFLGQQSTQVALYKASQRAPALTSAFDAVQSDKDVVAFGKVGNDGVPLPNIPAMASVWSSWGNTEGAIISGKAANPATAWATMATQIKAAIKTAS